MVRSLAALIAVALVACATGGDDGNYVPPSDDGGAMVDTGATFDGSATHGGDSGSSGPDPATDSGAGNDGSTVVDEEAGGQDAGADDTGTVVDDTGSPAPDSSGIGDVCPDTTKYELEAVAAAASGNALLCPISPSVCPSTDCCYQKASPASICVTK